MTVSTYIVLSDDEKTKHEFVLMAPLPVIRDFLMLQIAGEKRVLKEIGLLGVSRFHCSIRSKSYVLRPGPELLSPKDVERFYVRH